MPREPMPARRFAATRELRWPPDRGIGTVQVSVGFYADGRPAEVFVNGCKAGTDVQAVARDASIILSMALQHGVPLETVGRAITRDERGNAASLIGAVVDLVADEAKGMGGRAD